MEHDKPGTTTTGISLGVWALMVVGVIILGGFLAWSVHEGQRQEDARIEAHRGHPPN